MFKLEVYGFRRVQGIDRDVYGSRCRLQGWETEHEGLVRGLSTLNPKL